MKREARKRKNREIKKRTIAFALAAVMMVPMLALDFAAVTEVSHGAMATDTLTIKVGYWGMDTDDFMEKTTYNAQQLESLGTHDVAYSFCRNDKSRKSFGTVIDSARGVYIEDIITESGISLRDVNCIQFYTKDVSIGYFTSFTYNELFKTSRYYFNDLAGHFRPVYNESNEVVDVKLDSSAWNDKTLVKPMLAVEDHWESYEIPAENTQPNFSGMNAGNRFRLLFGQASPTESKTSQTAKYTHTMYVMFNGTPVIRNSGKVKVSNKVGSHQMTFNVAAGDEAFIRDLIKELKWSSSDETTLKITNISMKATSEYDDAVKVVIDYKILKEGASATITGSYKNLDLEGSIEVSDRTSSGDGNGSGDGKGDGSGDGKGDSKSDNGSKDPGDAGKKAGTGEYGINKNGSTNKDNNKTEDAKAKDTAGSVKLYALDEQIIELLNEKEDRKEYEQLEMPEPEDDSKSVFTAVGAGALLFTGAGAACGAIEFRRRK